MISTRPMSSRAWLPPLKKADTVLDAVERILRPKKVGDLTASRISTFGSNFGKEEGRRARSPATLLTFVRP